MFPGMNLNSRQMRQAMKKMGVQQQEIDAKEVIIRLGDKEIVITNPQVSKVNMMGQESYQITGEEHERVLSVTPDISEDDVKTVMEQTNCSEEKAKSAIEKSNGDLAGAILSLQK